MKTDPLHSPPPPEGSPPRPHTPSGQRPGYRWFTAGVGSWFGAFGMQGVLFSWILVGELDAASEWVGIAQTASMLPTLLLLMLGGVVADRFEPQRQLLTIHLLAPLPVLALATAAQRDALSIPGVIGFALAMGTLTAFGNPARDALLSRVAGADLMGAVSGMTATQFGAQALGSLIAGLARVIGTPTTLIAHAAVLLCGAVFAGRLPARAGHESAPQVGEPAPVGLRSTLHSMREGLAVVVRTQALRGTLLSVFAVGIFFIGPFSVILPLMVRDYYGGGVDLIAMTFALFPLGTISGSLALRRTGLPRKGRALLLALTAAAALQALLGSGLPLWGFALAIFGWGLGGAVFINGSRTIFQQHAPPAYRGRVLAAYQLGFTGGGPIGALASGYSIALFGLGGTFFISACSMGLLVIGMALLSRVAEIE